MIIHEIGPQIAAFFTASAQEAKAVCSNVTVLFQKKCAELGSTDFTFLGKQLYAFSTAAVKLMPFILLQQVTAGNCGTVYDPKSLYFQKSASAFRVNFDSSYTSASTEDIKKAAASCGFSALTTTLAGLFTAVESCVCFYNVPVGDGGLLQLSDLDLYQQNASSADTHCMQSALTDSCCPNSQISILPILLGMCVVVACCIGACALAACRNCKRPSTSSHHYVSING